LLVTPQAWGALTEAITLAMIGSVRSNRFDGAIEPVMIAGVAL
jgi:hypothetical protein